MAIKGFKKTYKAIEKAIQGKKKKEKSDKLKKLQEELRRLKQKKLGKLREKVIQKRYTHFTKAETTKPTFVKELPKDTLKAEKIKFL